MARKTKAQKEQEMAQQAQAETQTQEAQQTEEPKVTMADIAAALRIIDAAVERGAFKGKEITTVGATRDNLDRFVSYHEELQREQEEAEGGESQAEQG